MSGEVEFMSVWRLVWSLAAVMAAIPLAGLALRKWGRRVSSTAGNDPRLCSRLSLGAGVSLCAVEIEGRRYLLSVAPGRVELLDRLDEPSAKIAQESSPAAGKRLTLLDAPSSAQGGAR